MDVIGEAMARARGRGARVIFAESEEPRVAAAVTRLAGEGLAIPVIVPVPPPTEVEIAAVRALRPDMPAPRAARMLARPLFRAGAMLAAGQADAMVAGATVPTRRVIEAAGMTVGPAPGVGLVSSAFLMCLPDGRALVFADCALNVAPDAAGLADIARTSARTATALLGQARVAMLSFSTGASGSGASVDVVRAAAEALRTEGCDVTGPVQADAALNPAIAALKGLPGGGGANVLVFPSLDAGNIGYKLVQELAGAQAVGPLLQGFARPVCDLSRGASVDDIVAATVLTLALGGVT
ncbi:phosphate acetyltransferase [Maritimibacter sp. 55A14]|uniref:phosphate acyltransferase n=1 Tax=Maritimibacter sp. 55A14 TaxID=2174844 RepID=UPI000D612AD2|nr:phosphate acyltransferase [Maritimibacter sp. 55A14]PWE33841.1 phosphate acetyltransferase [Maritimibacter sp. 55A14]